MAEMEFCMFSVWKRKNTANFPGMLSSQRHHPTTARWLVLFPSSAWMFGARRVEMQHPDGRSSPSKRTQWKEVLEGAQVKWKSRLNTVLCQSLWSDRQVRKKREERCHAYTWSCTSSEAQRHPWEVALGSAVTLVMTPHTDEVLRHEAWESP